MKLVALGANLPGRFKSAAHALEAAKAQLNARGIRIIKSSRIFKTAPVPISDQPWYSNAVVAVETDLTPRDLLNTLNAIEHDMGRVRAERNAPRVIDLDIISYDDAVIDEDDLKIPHPRMNTRAFVLLPLRDVAPNWPGLDALIAKIPPDQIAHPQWFTDQSLFIMGIVNATPDSFSDGGAYDPLAQAKQLLSEGADIIDIGGESTRPNAAPLSPAEEQSRVLPVITSIKGAFISIDTRNASTMRAAITAGATMVNDVTALTHDPDALKTIAGFTGPVCLMHMQGTPETMQKNPAYENVVEDIYNYLSTRIDACVAAGIEKGRIVIDPGFGFGKTRAHNLALLENFERFTDLDVPVLAGLSRKTFLNPDVKPDQRITESVAAAQKAVSKGARILRVHDVARTREVLLK